MQLSLARRTWRVNSGYDETQVLLEDNYLEGRIVVENDGSGWQSVLLMGFLTSYALLS